MPSAIRSRLSSAAGRDDDLRRTERPSRRWALADRGHARVFDRNDDPAHASRPFDAIATDCSGEGAGIVILESLRARAETQRADLAEIAGTACRRRYHITQPAKTAMARFAS